MALLELNPVAVTAARLLRAVKTGGWTTRSELAEAAGKDPRNITRDLATCQTAGLITIADGVPPAQGIVLTDYAEQQLAALARAEHGGERRKPQGRAPLSAFAPNPDNRRVTAEAVAAMADTIEAAGDVLEALKALPPDANGVRILLDGETRWRAVGLLAEQGRLPEALAQGIRFEERPATEADQVLIRLITQARTALPPLEDARQLLALQRLTGWSAREIAKKTGRSPADSETGVRDVQLKIRIAKEATAEAVANYERDGSWDRLRDSVTQPKPAAETPVRPAEPDPYSLSTTTDRERLVLLEIADRCVRHPYRRPDTDVIQSPGRETTCGEHYPDPTGVSQSLIFHHGVGFAFQTDRPDTTSICQRTWDALLEAGDLIAGLGADPKRLRALREAVVGKAQADLLEAARKYYTPWLNVADDQPLPVRSDDTDLQPAATPERTAADDADPDDEPRSIDTPVQVGQHRTPFSAVEGGTEPLIVLIEHRNAAEEAGFSWRVTLEDTVHEQADPAEFMLGVDLARRRAIANIRRACRKDLPLQAVQWLDKLMGEFVVDGVDCFNASNAGERRRALGWEKRHSNSGGGGSRAQDLAERADTMAEQAAAGAFLVLKAALEEVIAEAEARVVGIRATLEKNGLESILEEFDADGESLRESIALADRAVGALGLAAGEGQDLADPGPSHGQVAAITGADGETRQPAVAVRKSITPEHIVCLEDGRKFVGGLRRHLRTRYDLSPEDYRARWGLPADYPMVAPAYAKRQYDLLRSVAP